LLTAAQLYLTGVEKVHLEEYTTFDATGLADLVRKGEVSPGELAALAAEGVAKVNPQLNAVIEVFDDRIGGLDEAALPAGPFRGVPFFLKDIGPRLKGRRQEAGSRLMQGYVADYSSFFTEQIERSGLNILGRTTCPEFGITGTTESILSGATGNPWDPSRIAGGSSGGSAAIVAAGVVPMAHSNDGGGSTRIPASICGNVGMKHSRGRTSYAPDGCDLTFPLFSDGVNAHTVRDVAGFLDVVQGPAPGEPIPFCKPDRPFVEEVLREPGRLRIAVCTDRWGPVAFDGHIASETARIARLCEGAGHEVEETAPPIDYDQYLQLFKRIWCIDIAVALDNDAKLMQRAVSLDTVEPMTLQLYEAGRGASAAERLNVTAAMSATARQLGAFFEDNDVLLTPALARPTPPLGSPFNLVQEGQSLEDWFENAFQLIPMTPLNNFTGTPAISLPLCKDPNGMPLGMHFTAPIGCEDRLFNLAGQLERMAPWVDERPDLHVASV
jgi:Asp-tRNA(Asn)/Glu-tRNA(Gln) amidotransferase A subunit family amidase